jgi:hypothetical protein
MSPEQLISYCKKLPPHEHENVPQHNLKIYESFGDIGWVHMMHEILLTENLQTKLKFIGDILEGSKKKKQS